MIGLVGEEPSVGIICNMLGGGRPDSMSSKRKTGRPALLVHCDG
eukprot:CAMPEP_0204041508 /NCGR_PEP_ID=MMETSP0360-20130528/94800_1 /ASSEMBLY_ACC=CAM_ASM_000342 /TAXON_ID=268821 /ORGANISM="Scrippsiella Hangoei, Strain SHTV-5" /LENGTH=43 /DNA_ID= /DNA_START= /DNA_END= /DNA_ORIENTATION=